MSEIKQRPVRDSDPNEKTGLLKNNTKTDYMSETNHKRPVLDPNPNELITFDSNPDELITFDSNPNEPTRQLDNYDIENGQTDSQTHKVCISSVFKNKWPPLKTF